MLQLIFYQFNYRKKQWFGTIPVLLVASTIIGTCLMITFNVMANTETFKQELPTPLFIGPIFFGGVTLLFLISSLIQLLLNSFKKDYQLWTILGASRPQLALLIGGQFAIISFLVSLVGSFCSFFVGRSYYLLVQGVTGEDYLPSIPFTFRFSAFILSVLILTLITFGGGFRYAFQLLKRDNLLEEQHHVKHNSSKLSRRIYLIVFGLLWLCSIVASFVIPFINLPGPVEYKLSFQVSLIFYLLIIHITLLQLLSPWIEMKLIKCLFRWKSISGLVIAKWTILLDHFYLKSLIVSLVTGITLVSGLLLLSHNSTLSGAEQIQETYVSFLFYLVAPIFIILANVVSLSIISSTQEKATVQQWQTLGVSKRDIVIIRLYESLIYSIIVIIISLICNLIIGILVLNIAKTSGILILNASHIYIPAIVISGVLLILIFATKVINSLKSEVVK